MHVVPMCRWGYSRTVLRHEGAVSSGRRLPLHQLLVHGRLCGSGILQRGNFPSSSCSQGELLFYAVHLRACHWCEYTTPVVARGLLLCTLWVFPAHSYEYPNFTQLGGAVVSGKACSNSLCPAVATCNIVEPGASREKQQQACR